MKTKIGRILIAAALGLWASTASANYISGKVECTDTSPATPLVGVLVTLKGTLNTYQNYTLADGTFSINVAVGVTDTYTVTIDTPAGLTITSPVGGQYSVPINGGSPDHFDGANFALTGCAPPCPDCVDPALGLGAAAGCTVLQLSSAKVSVTGPAGGIVGDICMGANSSLSMSGDNYVTGTVKLAPGAKISNSSHSSVNVLSNVDLSAEISAALNRAATAAALPATQTFTTLDGKTVTMINGVVGLNVIMVKDINLSGKQIYLNGPVGAQFILNVTGKFTLTGGGAGPQIRASGGVLPKDILYNIIGTGSDVAFSGGGGGVDCCQAVVDGTLLAPMRKINLSPGLVNGQIISGLDINIVSGSGVHCPPCP